MLADKAKLEITSAPEGTKFRVAFSIPKSRTLFKGTVTHVDDWGVRSTIDDSSFEVPVTWDRLVWWGKVS